MNKFYFAFAALVLGFAFGSASVFAVVEETSSEESTEVSSQVSEETSSEESTEVLGNQDSESAVESGEETTEVGNGGSEDEEVLEEETTEVGGSDAIDETPVEEEDNSSSRRSGSRRSTNQSSSDGEVLGAFTGSCPYLTTYMRMGQANDTEEVKKLQQFLNDNLSISLPVTGYFGEMTDKAVRDFQLKYSDAALLPWVEAGLLANDETSTGYVYKTTLHTINKIVCPDMDVALPVLN